MNTLFSNFHQQVKRRVEKFGSFHSFGEDSIRYDFYHTAIKQFHLLPEELILEQAIPSSQFTPKQRESATKKQGRHEDKPEFDLRIDPTEKLTSGIIAEFAYFRGTEKSSNQPRSAKFGKLLNEICRLALLKHFRNEKSDISYADFSSYKCLLICVSDEEMMDFGTFINGTKVKIGDEFILSDQFISSLCKSAKEKIDVKFFQHLSYLGIVPKANRVFAEQVNAKGKLSKLATWVWEIDFINA